MKESNIHTLAPRTEHSVNARTREDFAKLITEAWQSSIEGIFKTGMWLETAKAELKHGSWLAMIKSDLPFEERTAQMLMKIADHENIRNAKHVSYLPASWGTLYELTKLDDGTFIAAIADGRINPKMERKDALALRPAKPKKPKREKAANDYVQPPPARASLSAGTVEPPKIVPGSISPQDQVLMHIQQLVLDTAGNLTKDELRHFRQAFAAYAESILEQIDQGILDEGESE